MARSHFTHAHTRVTQVLRTLYHKSINYLKNYSYVFTIQSPESSTPLSIKRIKHQLDYEEKMASILEETRRTMESVILLNTQAIALMHNKKYEAAADLFGEGLQRFETNDMTDEEAEQLVPMPVMKPISIAAQDTMRDDLGTFSMYKNSISLAPGSPCGYMIRLETLHEVLSCVLLFNIGLSLHISFFSSGKHANMDEAFLAYQVALTDYDCWNNTANHPSLLYLELCLLNNSGHIQSHHLDSEMRVCIARMAAKLHRMTNGGKLVHESLMCFYRNVVCNQRSFERMAPAA
jgi:hypothetical protein